MRVLTVREPWVTAIFRAGKDVENRAWSTPYRGPMAIHVAKRPDPGATRWDAGIDDDALPRGCIVGVVDLVDIVRDSSSEWAALDCWHWIIANPRVIKPIPWRGAVQLRQLPSDVAAMVYDERARLR